MAVVNVRFTPESGHCLRVGMSAAWGVLDAPARFVRFLYAFVSIRRKQTISPTAALPRRRWLRVIALPPERVSALCLNYHSRT